jgi:RNA polymerase sigma factor (sigma-70 family)
MNEPNEERRLSEPSSGQEFQDFIVRIRAGDEHAAEQLYQKYERLVRREVRMHLLDPRLKRMYDTVDFTQSIMASFFFRAGNGEYQLSEPADLIRLLVTIARNKIASSSRRLLSQKRDAKRSFVDSFALDNHAENADSPSIAASLRELIAKANEQLTEEERSIQSMRRNGASWEVIAEQLGGTAQSRRMQLSRALDRISEKLGLDADESR